MSQQLSFDPLTYADNMNLSDEAAHAQAMKERNATLRQMRKEGKKVRGWTLTGQLRPWASMGVPDGRVRNIYYISVAA